MGWARGPSTLPYIGLVVLVEVVVVVVVVVVGSGGGTRLRERWNGRFGMVRPR